MTKKDLKWLYLPDYHQYAHTVSGKEDHVPLQELRTQQLVLPPITKDTMPFTINYVPIITYSGYCYTTLYSHH